MSAVLTVRVEEIDANQRLRPVDPMRAAEIAASIKRNGLFHPIVVFKGGKAGNPYVLSAGAQRLAAVKLNGGETIEARVMTGTAAERELVEAEENLCREDLAPFDRALFVRRWKEKWEEANPDLKDAGRRGHAGAIARWLGKDALAEMHGNDRSLAAEADKLGLSKKIIQQSLLIASLADDKTAAELVRTVPQAQSRDALLALARLDPKKRKSALDLLHREPALSASEAVRQASGVKATPPKPPAVRILALWSAATAAERKQIVAALAADKNFVERFGAATGSR